VIELVMQSSSLHNGYIVVLYLQMHRIVVRSGCHPCSTSLVVNKCYIEHNDSLYSPQMVAEQQRKITTTS